MYESTAIANQIKHIAKRKNIIIKQMLIDLNLGVNTMNNMKTSTPKSDSLAKIADYLECSVDYLLGRTDNESIGKTDITPIIAKNKKENELLKMFRELDYEAQGDIFDIVKLKYEKSIQKALEKSSASVGTNEGVNIA